MNGRCGPLSNCAPSSMNSASLSRKGEPIWSFIRRSSCTDMARGNEAVIASLYDLSGNVALITGGGRGLGLEMARAFAQCGADLFLASRKLDNCEAAVKEVAALGRRPVAYRCNAGGWRDLDALEVGVETCRERVC